jgi:hypothetical protein
MLALDYFFWLGARKELEKNRKSKKGLLSFHGEFAG